MVPEVVVHFKNRSIVNLGHGDLQRQRCRPEVQGSVLLRLEGALQPLCYEVFMFDFEIVY